MISNFGGSWQSAPQQKHGRKGKSNKSAQRQEEKEIQLKRGFYLEEIALSTLCSSSSMHQ
jgi:hypothetical protein